jgi:hypothetical protein
MAYNGNWINELVNTEPPGSESKSFGDDAIREIKRSLTNSFPNVQTGDAYTGTLSQLSDLAAGATLPFNTIISWIGLEADVPAGWTICDGRLRPGGGNAPDLRGKFLMGGQAEDATNPHPFLPIVNQLLGNNETVIDEGNGQLVQLETKNTILQEQHLPAHSHGMFKSNGANQGDPQPGTSDEVAGVGFSGDQGYEMKGAVGGSSIGVTANSGTGQGHSHKFTIETTNTGSNVPECLVVLILIKD